MKSDTLPPRPRRRLRPLGCALAFLGVLLATGSAAAAAAAVVHGKGELVSQPLTGDLEVIDVRLEPLLIPGAASDLVLQVRNRSGFTVVADRVRLQLPLREARPAGCAAKVSGPLLASNGVALIGKQRVTFGPGRAGQVVVPSALSLSADAKGGCGFRAVIDVQAVQATPTTPPTTPPTTRPTTPPTTPPTTAATTTPTPPTSLPTTSTTITPPPSDATVTPPTMPTLDCDPVDPTCTPG